MKTNIVFSFLLLASLSASADEILHVGACHGKFCQQLTEKLLAIWKRPGLQLVKTEPNEDLEQLRALQKGEIQVAVVHRWALTNFERVWGRYSLPFPLQENLYPAKSEFTVLADFDWGERFLATPTQGTRLSELRRLQVRGPRSKVFWEFYSWLGTKPQFGKTQSWAGDTCALDLEREPSRPLLRLSQCREHLLVLKRTSSTGTFPPCPKSFVTQSQEELDKERALRESQLGQLGQADAQELRALCERWKKRWQGMLGQ